MILVFVCGGAVFGAAMLGTYLMQLSLWIGFGYLGVFFLIGIGLAAYFEVKDE